MAGNGRSTAGSQDVKLGKRPLHLTPPRDASHDRFFVLPARRASASRRVVTHQHHAALGGLETEHVGPYQLQSHGHVSRRQHAEERAEAEEREVEVPTRSTVRIGRSTRHEDLQWGEERSFVLSRSFSVTVAVAVAGVGWGVCVRVLGRDVGEEDGAEDRAEDEEAEGYLEGREGAEESEDEAADWASASLAGMRSGVV